MKNHQIKFVVPAVVVVAFALFGFSWTISTDNTPYTPEQGSNIMQVLYADAYIFHSLVDEICEDPGLDVNELTFSYMAQKKAGQLDELLRYMHRKKGFHGNVLVAKEGRVIYQNAFGYANMATKKELELGDAFQLASVSKQFTAMSIMLLAEEGKLSYDDKVVKYYPRLPYKEITIRNLLNHTGGLPDYMWMLEKYWQSEQAPNNQQTIKMMADLQLSYNYTPGKSFQYSNTGYMLLAGIVEKVAEESFAQFVEDNIFEPLGMGQSFVYSTASKNQYPERVKGYHRNRRGYFEVGDFILNGPVGDKGIYSTTADLYKWDHALEEGRLVSSETLKTAFTNGKTTRNRMVPYGFGYRLRHSKGDKIVYHNGLWNGFRTSFIKNMNDHTTIIVLNHTNSAAKNNLVRRIETIMQQHEVIPNSNTLLAMTDENGHLILN